MAAEPPPPHPTQPSSSWDSWPYGWDAGPTQDVYGGYGAWGQPSWVEPAPPPPLNERPFRRWFVAVVLLVIVVIGAVAGVGVSVWRANVTPAASSGSGPVSGSAVAVDRAVVDVTSRLADGSGVAAGTGMIISSSGEVL